MDNETDFEKYIALHKSFGLKIVSRIFDTDKTVVIVKSDRDLREKAIAIFNMDGEFSIIPTYEMEDKKLITCVYCGHEYPDQTPTHGAQVLKDHIKVCEKHPMREAEEKIKILWNALSGLIGAKTKEELQQMETMMVRATIGVKEDKVHFINGIHALLKTID